MPRGGRAKYATWSPRSPQRREEARQAHLAHVERGIQETRARLGRLAEDGNTLENQLAGVNLNDKDDKAQKAHDRGADPSASAPRAQNDAAVEAKNSISPMRGAGPSALAPAALNNAAVAANSNIPPLRGGGSLNAVKPRDIDKAKVQQPSQQQQPKKENATVSPAALQRDKDIKAMIERFSNRRTVSQPLPSKVPAAPRATAVGHQRPAGPSGRSVTQQGAGPSNRMMMPQAPAIPPIRRVIVSNLPSGCTARDIFKLLWGGDIEKLIYTDGETTAEALFVNPASCARYWEDTTSKVEFKGKAVSVEMAQNIEPLVGPMLTMVTQGFTRCLRAEGVSDDLLPGALLKLAKATGTLEHMVISAANHQRVITYRFTGIEAAQKFRADLAKKAGFEKAKITYEKDPCAMSSGVHN